MAKGKKNVEKDSGSAHPQHMDENLQQLKSQLIEEEERKTVLDQVKKVAEYILKQNGITSEGDAISGREIYEKYVGIKSTLEGLPEINYNSFMAYLSRVSNSPDSQIICPGRRKGYYWDEAYKPIESSDEIEIRGPGGINESHLYGVVKSWLLEKCDIAADISSRNGNKLWGNPDLVGFKFHDLLNRSSFEIYSVELKLTPDSWRRWIFEAVSHTRFANRAYFAFLYPENWKAKLEGEDMRLYAEHFRIGILVLGITEEKYYRIRNRDENVHLDDSEINFIEYHQAPYTPSHPKFKNDFLQSIEIFNYKKLHQFVLASQ